MPNLHTHPPPRSTSHPNIFAGGDIASIVGHPRPKAGVFAVMCGMPLYKNIVKTLKGIELRPPDQYLPQSTFLGLIGTGDGGCVASKGAVGMEFYFVI